MNGKSVFQTIENKIWSIYVFGNHISTCSYIGTSTAVEKLCLHCTVGTTILKVI